MKKIILIAILLIPFGISARSKTSCDYKLVSNLKKLASSVDISYTYNIVDDNVYYDITFDNIRPDFYFIYEYDGNIYRYSDSLNGKIVISGLTPGNSKFVFYSNSDECMNEKLLVKNINLPYYNKYYHYDECIGIENYHACKKWVLYNNSYENFVLDINNYKKSLIHNNTDNDISINDNIISRFLDFYFSYYYLIIPILIVLIVAIYYLIKFLKNRKNRFDL